MKELEARQNMDYFQKHYTPMDMQKLNFIERKLVVNHLSYDSVVKQYQKSLCIVLALAEQRLVVTNALDVQMSHGTSLATGDLETAANKDKSSPVKALFPHLHEKHIKLDKNRHQKMKKTHSMQSDMDKAANENYEE